MRNSIDMIIYKYIENIDKRRSLQYVCQLDDLSDHLKWILHYMIEFVKFYHRLILFKFVIIVRAFFIEILDRFYQMIYLNLRNSCSKYRSQSFLTTLRWVTISFILLSCFYILIFIGAFIFTCINILDVNVKFDDTAISRQVYSLGDI